jgi:hypothetical protein
MLAAAFEAEPPTPLPFPWKTLPVAEAKLLYSPQQLQDIIMSSIREHGDQTCRLVIKDLETIPSELEKATQRLKDLKGYA